METSGSSVLLEAEAKAEAKLRLKLNKSCG